VVVLISVLSSLGGGDGDEDSGSSTTAGVTLPQGPEELGNDVVVWANETDWTLEFAAPGDPVARLPHDPNFAATWPVVLNNRRTVLYLRTPIAEPRSTTATSLRVVGTDGRGDRQLFGKSEVCPNPGRPSVNPGGDRIALVCFDDNGDRLPGLRILRLDGSLARPVLHEDAIAGNPTWSPDGDLLVYWVQTGDNSSLWAIEAGDDATSLQFRLPSGSEAKDSLPSISPDGRWIVFVRSTPADKGDLYLISTRNEQGVDEWGTPERMQASASRVTDTEPTWSLDSQWIVYSAGGVLKKVAPEARAPTQPLFGDSPSDRRMPAWARR